MGFGLGTKLTIALTSCALAAVLAPAGVLASVAGKQGQSIIVTAAPGERNQIAIDFANAGIVVIQDGAGIAESPDSAGCNQVSPTQVNCQRVGLSQLEVDAGDLSDRITAVWLASNEAPAVARVDLDAGTGNDRASVVNIPAELALSLSAGNDSAVVTAFSNPFGSGFPIAVRGGAGNDRVSSALTIQSGASGATIPRLTETSLQVLGGGSGSDNLRIRRGAGTIRGQAGDDALRGGADRQRILGGGGNDLLVGDDDDICRGGAGDNRLRGGC